MSELSPLSLGEPLSDRALRRIRRELELHHHKWDAQVGDQTALAATPLLLSESAWLELSRCAEALFTETCAVEEELLQRTGLQRELGLPRPLRKLLQSGRALTP